MRRIAVIAALIGAMSLISAAPAPAQTLTPSRADFPPTPLRTDSAPIRFTYTAGSALFTSAATGFGNQTYAMGTFKETNNCPDLLSAGQSCFIDVVFAPYLPTPVHKENTFYVGNLSAPVTGDVKARKKKCKKGKKGTASAAKKKCKKKK